MSPLFRVIILLLLFQNSALAQRKNVDSILAIVNHLPDDTAKVQTLAELGYRYYQINNDSTFYYAEKALHLAQKLQYEIGVSMGYNRMAVALAAKGNLPKAIEYYYLALQKAEKANDEKWISSALNNLGYVYRQLNDYEKAQTLTVRAYEMSKKSGNKRSQAINLTNLAWLNESIGKLNGALSDAYKAVTLATEVKDDYHIAISYHILGKIYIKIGNWDSAFICFSNGLHFANISKINSQIAFNTLGLGETGLKRGKTADAIPLLQTALLLATNNNVLEIKEQAAKLLSEAFIQSKNFEKALYYNNLYLNFKDSLFNINKQKIITRTQLDYDIEKKQQKLLQQQLELKQQRTITIFFIVVALVLTAFLFNINKNRKIVKQQNAQLFHANEEMQVQRLELIKQADELRVNNQYRDKLFSILAHDLRAPLASFGQILEHIDLLSSEELKTVKSKLETKFSDIDAVLTNLLVWSRQQLQGAMQQKKEVNIAELITKNIQLLTLSANSKKIDIVNTVPTQLSVYSDEQQVGIVVRNIVANAIKFTNPGGKIEITGSTINNSVLLQFADNGIGMTNQQLNSLFNPKTHFSNYGTAQEKGVGLGLLLCKEFIEKNGGKIWAQSEKGVGTTFFVEIPSKPAEITGS